MLILQGLSVAAVIMLCLNLLTIRGPTIYNVSAAACHLLRSERRRTLTLAAAGVGIVLAIGGMYEMLIPFLVLLGSIIPPIGGVILADYWFARGGRYPLLQNARLPRFNWLGLGAYAAGAVVAYLSPWIAPLVGDLRFRAGLYRPDSAKQTPACRRRGAGAMSLTVSELLALEGLSALRLRAGKQGLQRAVRWYYVAENEHIAEWIMGGELVFITGINHPRDEANLIQLLMEGKQRGIAGMVILTGEAYIHAIPATLIALADELGMPLIEQPYLLKMVIVTERIGTALVRSENVLQSQRDISDAAGHRRLSGPADAPSARPAPAARFYPSAAAGGAASGGVVPPVSPVPARAGRSLAAAGPPQRASAAAAAAQPAGQFLSAAGAQQHVPFPAAG